MQVGLSPSHLLCLALAFANTPALSQDGNFFLNACAVTVRSADGVVISPDEQPLSTFCLGYIAGFMDATSLASTFKGRRSTLCLPESGTSNEQAARLFVKYLRENPEQLHESGRMSLYISLSRVFRCKQ